MRYLLHHCTWGCCALVVCLFSAARPAQGQPVAPDSPPRLQCPDTASPDTNLNDGCAYGNIFLRKTSYDIAKIVCSTEDPKTCALPERIKQLGNMTVDQRCTTQATKALILRQEIAEMVLTASLQVDGFVDEIDSETSQIRAVHDRLSDNRDKAVGRSTLGSAVGSAGGAVSQALALATGTAMTVGSWVGAFSGGAGALYGFLGYFQAKGPKGCFPDFNSNANAKETQCPDLKEPIKLSIDPNNYKGDPCEGKSSHGCSPSMLSYFLFKIDPGFHSKPDPIVEGYLNNHRSELSAAWGFDQSKLDALKTTESSVKLSKDDQAIEALITRNESPRKLSIDDLTDRANKLADIRVVASRINRDLSRLTDDLAKSLRCVLP